MTHYSESETPATRLGSKAQGKGDKATKGAVPEQKGKGNAPKKANAKDAKPIASSSTIKEKSAKGNPGDQRNEGQKSSKAPGVRRKGRGNESEADDTSPSGERGGKKEGRRLEPIWQDVDPEGNTEGEEEGEDDEDEYRDNGVDEYGDDDEGGYENDAMDEDEERVEHEATSEQDVEDKHGHTHTNNLGKRSGRFSDSPPFTSKKPSTNLSSVGHQSERAKEKGKGKEKEKETQRQEAGQKDSRKDKGKGVARGTYRYVVAHFSTHHPLTTTRATNLPDKHTKKNEAATLPPVKNAESTSKDSAVRRYVSQPTAKAVNTAEASQRRCFSQADVSLSSSSPQWLRDATRYFRSLQLRDSRWLGIVDCLIRLEFAMEFPDSGVCLSSTT